MNKPYTMTPPPNYRLCTDPDDIFQLTDGKTQGCDWSKQSVVGWQTPESYPRIRIDFGHVKTISGIRIHTTSGTRASVHLPEQILVSVSNDGDRFHLVKAFDNTNLEQKFFNITRRTPYTFSEVNLHTAGRFVEIVFVLNGTYLFLDELEVLSGQQDIETPFSGSENTHTIKNLESLIKAHRKVFQLREEILEFQNRIISTNSGLKLYAPAKALLSRVNTLSLYSTEEHLSLQKDFESLRGQWLNEQTKSSIIFKNADPFSQSTPNEVYWYKDNPATNLLLSLWQGEYESGALTIVNCTPFPAIATICISPLRGSDGREYSSEETITIRRAVNVDAIGKGLVGDALPLLNSSKLIIRPGSSSQIWITVHNPQLIPGEYKFAIGLNSEFDGNIPSFQQAVQGAITIHPIRFPGDPSLLTRNCAYLRRYRISHKALSNAITDLEQHYTNVYVIPCEDLPHGKPTLSGQLFIDFSRHDSAIALYPNAKQYLFYWGYTQSTSEKKGYRHKWGDWMSERWKESMRIYLVQWVKHLHQLGLGYERYAMFPYDESLCEEFEQLAAFIKQVDPNIRIFANSPGKQHSSQLERIASNIDVWCLPENRIESQRARKKLASFKNKATWRYDCQGNAKALSPLLYYRQQPWRAWASGDMGCAFWVYLGKPTTQQGSGWNDIGNTKAQWDVVYLAKNAPVNCGKEHIIPSRRWEAWREGIEDYEYLVTLDRLISDLDAAGFDTLASQGKQVLEDSVRSVLKNSTSSTSIYKARKQITKEIIALSSKKVFQN